MPGHGKNLRRVKMLQFRKLERKKAELKRVFKVILKCNKKGSRAIITSITPAASDRKNATAFFGT